MQDVIIYLNIRSQVKELAAQMEPIGLTNVAAFSDSYEQLRFTFYCMCSNAETLGLTDILNLFKNR